VTLAEGLRVTWPGRGVGNHRQPYYRKSCSFEESRGVSFAVTHPSRQPRRHATSFPSFALPAKNFDNKQYLPEMQQCWRSYEQKYGPPGPAMSPRRKCP